MELFNALKDLHFEGQSKKRENLEVVDADRIAIYLELMDSYQQLGRLVCFLTEYVLFKIQKIYFTYV